MTGTETAPAGWYSDGSGGQRYWDGTQWAENTGPSATGTGAAPDTFPNRWAWAAAAGAVFMVLALVVTSFESDKSISFRFGAVSVPTVVGIIVGAVAAKRVGIRWRHITAIGLPFVVGFGWLVVLALPGVVERAEERESIGGDAQSKIVLPGEIVGWRKVDTPESRAMADQALATFPKELGVTPVIASYAKGAAQLMIIGLNPPEGSDLGKELAQSPVQFVEGELAGAKAENIETIDAGIDGVAMQCGLMLEQLVFCAWADSASAGMAYWPGEPNVAGGGKATQGVLEYLREPIP